MNIKLGSLGGPVSEDRTLDIFFAETETAITIDTAALHADRDLWARSETLAAAPKVAPSHLDAVTTPLAWDDLVLDSVIEHKVAASDSAVLLEPLHNIPKLKDGPIGAGRNSKDLNTAIGSNWGIENSPTTLVHSAEDDFHDGFVFVAVIEENDEENDRDEEEV